MKYAFTALKKLEAQMAAHDEPVMILIRSKTNTIKIKTKAIKSEDNYEDSKENLKHPHDKLQPVDPHVAKAEINAEHEGTELAEKWPVDMKGVIKLETPTAKKFKKSSDGRFQCRFCKSNFRVLGRLEKHMVQHYTRTVYHCDSCNLDFTAFHLLLKHFEQHMMAKPYGCSGCAALFQTSAELEGHVRSGTCNVSGLREACVLCSATFSSSRAWKGHISKHHTRMSYMCTHCGQHYDTESELRAHVMSHEDEERPWRKREVCEFCKRTFASKSGLHEHKQNQHFGIRAHCCRYCGRDYSTRSNLRRHIKYTCNVDGKRPETNTVAPGIDLNTKDSVVVEPDLPLIYIMDETVEPAFSWMA